MLHGFSRNNDKSVLDFYGQRLCKDHLFHRDGLDKENYNVCRLVFLGCNFVHGCQNNNTYYFLLYLLCSSIPLNPSHQSPSSLILLHLYLHTPIIHYSNTISTIITLELFLTFLGINLSWTIVRHFFLEFVPPW